MQERIDKLEGEVSELKAIVKQLQSGSATSDAPTSETTPNGAAEAKAQAAQQNGVRSEDRQTLDFFRDTTINVGLDTYYAYNFNHPVGRVNLLRAFDVLSNEISLNQASVILEHAPDLNAGRRWGARLDLQFGQATDTLQGNPSNEPRPQIYRNIFQAYGTYVIPVGKGINVDFGKWSSSLGIEGNYTKDQINYSRAYWFYFLPFYHMGLRANIPVNDRFSINYWVVNGTNQVEATNGFKDQLFGFTAKPNKNINWTVNYYLGQEHPDRAPTTSCGPVPVQPGLCFAAIRPAPNGRTHIFDSYVTWNATPKMTLALEGDYFIQRLWQNSAPGQSSAPSHTDGGAAYIQYQVTPKIALATRAEYMSDRGALFSGISQALKENTVTLDYKVSDGLLMRYEWRRDFSNQPSFLSDVQGVLNKDQNTATVGLLWWWGRKEGSW
jgi:Putative beta-barrel porin-2, OmpL-like. bbp2